MTKATHTGRQGLRDEAAGWFALMRGPEADARRLEFESWLAADPRHRAAYNRIGEAFSLGKGLKNPPDAVPEAPAFSATMRRPAWTPAKAASRVAVAAALILAILVSTTVLLRTLHPFLAGPSQAEHRLLVTSRGEIRSFFLADGSRVTLDTDSQVSVAFSALRRDLKLTRGRARFTVAHESRPFVVAAAGGVVTARGTVFDITLDAQRSAVVDLIEGAVDVQAIDAPRGGSAGTAQQARQTRATRLTAGHSLALGVADRRPPIRLLASVDWPDGLRDFKAARLGDLVIEANRYAGKPIVLASDDLAELQVSGTFGIRNTRNLAGNLAELLGLIVREKGDVILLVDP